MTLGKGYVQFFKELAANNNREWFHANKKRYEKDVKEPFHQLVKDVIARMKKIDPKIDIEPKDALFRINRDIRFSKDKSPYKTYMAAVVSRGGRKNTSIPGIYFHIAPDEVWIGGGCHEPEKDLLYKIREAMVRDPKRVKKITEAKKFKEVFGEVQGEKNKILPPEFKEAAGELPLLYNKSFHYMAHYKGEKQVTRDDLVQFIVDHYNAAEGWNEFLMEVAEGG